MKSIALAGSLLTAFALMVVGPTASASDWEPDGPITFMVGFGAGGSADTLSRAIAAELQESRGWRIVVENRPGGGGAVMAGTLVRRPADGQVVGMAVSEAMVTSLATRDDMAYGLDDFDYLATVAAPPVSLLARSDAPFDDLAGLIAHAKQEGGATVSVISRGAELVMRAVARDADAPIRTMPTRGGAESMQQILGGHVDAGFDAGSHMPQLESGDVKLIAAATGARHPLVSDQPTVTEQGYDYQLEPYFYFSAPKGLPDDVKDGLSAALDDAINSPAVTRLLEEQLRIEVRNLGPEGTEELLTRQLNALESLIKAAE